MNQPAIERASTSAVEVWAVPSAGYPSARYTPPRRTHLGNEQQRRETRHENQSRLPQQAGAYVDRHSDSPEAPTLVLGQQPRVGYRQFHYSSPLVQSPVLPQWLVLRSRANPPLISGVVRERSCPAPLSHARSRGGHVSRRSALTIDAIGVLHHAETMNRIPSGTVWHVCTGPRLFGGDKARCGLFGCRIGSCCR